MLTYNSLLFCSLSNPLQQIPPPPHYKNSSRLSWAFVVAMEVPDDDENVRIVTIYGSFYITGSVKMFVTIIICILYKEILFLLGEGGGRN